MIVNHALRHCHTIRLDGRHAHARVGMLISIISGLIWLWFTPIAPAFDADPIEMQIDALTVEALNAPTVEAAQKKIVEAETLLKHNQTEVKKITYRFLLSNLALTNGRIKAAAWQQQTDDEELRTQAQQILSRILPEQEALKIDTDKAADELEQKLGAEAEADPWQQQLWAYGTRLEYNIAWTQYSLAIVTPEENARLQLLQKAFDGFQPFTQDGYENHPVIAECFLGQGLCLFEQKKYYDVIRFLDLDTITPETTPVETYKRISYLRIQSARRLPSDVHTIWAAEQFFNSLDDDERLDKTELAMALDWARSLAALAQSPESRTYHHNVLQRIERVAALVYPYGDPFSADLARIIETLPADMPYVCMVLGRRCFQEKKYESALQYAQTGIRNLTEKVSAQLSADLYFLENAAAWNVQAWHSSFRAAQVFLRRHTEDDRTEKVLQRGIQSALKSLSTDLPVDLDAFMQFLDFAQQHWPEHPEVKKAPWYRGWVFLETQRYADAYRLLQNVAPDSTVYPHALYGLALASLKQAQDQVKQGVFNATVSNLRHSDRSEESQSLGDSETLRSAQGDREEALVRRQHLYNASDSIARFVELPPEKPSPQQKELRIGIVDVGLAAAQALLKLTPPDPNAALVLLDTLERLPNITTTRDPAALHKLITSPLAKHSEDSKRFERRLSLRLEANAYADQIDRVVELLDILITIKNHSEVSLHALIQAGNVLERGASQPARDEDSKRIFYDKLIALYQLLLTQAQQKKHTMLTESVVRRRLAHSLALDGRRLDAVDQYLWILQHEPAHKTGDVRRLLALVYEQLERFDAAIEQWRILANGLAPDTEPWLEANYRLIQNHLQVQNPQQAKKLLALFQLRHPHIESQTWRHRFAELDQKLSLDIKSK